MTQHEYKQKRRECWEEFKREHLDGEVPWQPVSRYDVFLYAFDCAYALGREKNTIHQKEIQNAAEEYTRKHFLNDAEVLVSDPWPEAMKRYKQMLMNFGSMILPQLNPEKDNQH